MKRQMFRWLAALAVVASVVGCGLALRTCPCSGAKTARAKIQGWADRFAWYAGLSWHYGEQMADDVRTDAAALKDKLLPRSSDATLPTPSGAQQLELIDAGTEP